MGGADSHASPARVLGPSSAGYSTGPTPFVRVSDTNPITRTMPGGGDATGADPAIRLFGHMNGASDSTVPVPSPFRNPPGFSTSPERPAPPAAQWLPPL
eukprot:16354609-Heterocapsa_arctica.AAC.1